MSTQQILQIGGTAIGMWFGYPQLGFMLGSLAASFVPPEGPDPGDLSAPQITAGSAMWRGYGSPKRTGSPIWMSEFHAVEEGGKGGEPPSVRYTIDVIFHVYDGANFVALLRAWVNKAIKYSALASSDVASLRASQTTNAWESLEFCDGNPGQQPWSVHEDAKGVGNVSAHRGLTTIRIKGLNCGGSKSLPLCEFELATNATVGEQLDGDTGQSVYAVSRLQVLAEADPDWQPLPEALEGLVPGPGFANVWDTRTIELGQLEADVIYELARISLGDFNSTSPSNFGDCNVDSFGPSPPIWNIGCVYTPGPTYLNNGNAVYLLGVVGQTTYEVYTPLPVTLASIIIAELSRNEAIDLADHDTSLCEAIEVDEYQCSGSSADALSKVCDMYYVDLAPGNPLRWVPRGQAVVATLTNGEVGAPGQPFSGLKEDNDDEQPALAGLQFPNRLNNHNPGFVQADRLATPSASAKNLSTLVGFTPSQAKGRAIAYNLLRTAARFTAETRWSDRRSTLQPGDAILLPDEKGNLYNVLIRASTYDGTWHKPKLELNDVSALVFTGIASTEDHNAIIVVPPTVAEFLPLNLPNLLGAADNDAGYWGLVKTGNTTGSRWLDSPDDTTYTERANYVNNAVFGTVTAASGSFTPGVLFDEGSSLTVNVGDGTLASATRDALLADRELNAFAVGLDDRMVLGQFRNAELVSAGVYTLTGFVNLGDRGTEQFCPSIAVDDAFALLGVAGTARIPDSLTDLGATTYVKGVANDQAAASVDGVPFVNWGVSLIPLSPVLLRADRDASTGDIAIRWTRRTRMPTRFGGDLGDAYPLGEAAELYHVRLYTDGTFATVLRDFGSVSSPTVPYTAAQRAVDGLGLYAPLHVDVRMVSDQVGAGYPLQDAA